MVKINQVKKWLTPTAINTYLKCPRSFFYKYVRKFKSKLKKQFMRGKAIHKLPEYFFKENIYGKAETYSELRHGIINLLAKKWIKSKDEIEELQMTDQEKNETYLEVHQMALNWLHAFLADKTKDTKPLVEHKLFNHEHHVWCILDILKHRHTHPEIIDYKSSKKLELTDSIKLQLAIQSLCFAKKYRRMDHKLGVHFLRFPISSKNPIYLKPSKELHDFAIEKIMIVRKGTTTIDIKDYPCKCSGWCEEDYIFEDERRPENLTTVETTVQSK